MEITLLDTKTGKTRTFDTTFDAWYWTEGNGSCDCNRAIQMDCDEEMDVAMRLEHPELKPWQSYCYGARRFLIVNIGTSEYTLDEFNQSYPDELKQKWLA